MISFVAFNGGVAKSSSPLTTRVSTLEDCIELYWLSPGVDGQASANRPLAHTNVVAASPRIEPLWLSDAKYTRLACTSARATAATSPQTWAVGKVMSLASDMNHRPLGSPLAAASHDSRVIGPEIGAAA